MNNVDKPKVLCVIPARIGSTRLERKPLALIGDKPLVQRTYEAASLCPDLDKVVVATDSEEIATVIEQCGGITEMTSADIKTGSDRVAVVAERYPEMDVIINLQGDEPFIKPIMLSELIQPFLQNRQLKMATLAFPLADISEYKDPNIVKVISNIHNDAIYFSRSPIPFQRNPKTPITALHHMGIYAFSRDFLKVYCNLPQTQLEIIESLEQLRAIEHGYKIYVRETQHRTLEINTPDELERARQLVNAVYAPEET